VEKGGWLAKMNHDICHGSCFAPYHPGTGSYTKLCDFTLLFMILQVELQLNKGSLVRPRLVDQVKAHASIMTICKHYRDLHGAQNGV
jgi:hypothetical protein